MDELHVIVEPAGLVITPDSYRTHERHREIADRVLSELGHDPDDVVEIRISETATEVDWLWRRDGRLVDAAIRTTRHEARAVRSRGR